MLETEPDVQPLRAWASELAQRRSVIVPQFDPAEAGVQSRVLLLLEAPGPMTNADAKRPGSGFISVDNWDETAKNVWNTRNDLGFDRGILAWNIVPWYLGAASRKPTSMEREQGARELLSLMNLLTHLDTVVVAGEHAKDGWQRYVVPILDRPLRALKTSHPGPLAFNRPHLRNHFIETMREASQK